MAAISDILISRDVGLTFLGSFPLAPGHELKRPPFCYNLSMHLHGHYETQDGYACHRCGWELSKEDISSNPKTKELLEALESDGIKYLDQQ